MARLGFDDGGRIDEYKKKLNELENYIAQNRLVSKEAQMSSLSGEGYSDPRFIKTTGNKLIDKYGMNPFPAEGSGKILSTKELGMKGEDSLINPSQKGTFNSKTDVIEYKDISKRLPSHTPERTQIHEIVHRAAHRSGWLDNFYNDEKLKKIAPKVTGTRGKQLTHLINEGLAHSYDYTLTNKKIDSEELKEQIEFRVSRFNIRDDDKDKVTQEIFESLPALQENFENYLKDLDKKITEDRLGFDDGGTTNKRIVGITKNGKYYLTNYGTGSILVSKAPKNLVEQWNKQKKLKEKD
jgi:hypothetical protein